MAVRRGYILLISVVLFLTGCSQALDHKAYMAYVSNPENGLVKTRTVGDFEVSVRYEPADFIIAGEQEKGSVDSEFKSSAHEFEHFQFRIKLKQGGNILNYKSTSMINQNSRINHFSFNARQDFKIISGGKAYPCKLTYYSRNYNLTPTVDISLVFDRIPLADDWQLVYTDQQFDLGRIKFLLKQNHLADLPTLKTKQDEVDS